MIFPAVATWKKIIKVTSYIHNEYIHTYIRILYENYCGKTRCRSARVFRVKNGLEKMRGGKIRASAKVFMHKIAIIPSSSHNVVRKSIVSIFENGLLPLSTVFGFKKKIISLLSPVGRLSNLYERKKCFLFTFGLIVETFVKINILNRLLTRRWLIAGKSVNINVRIH